MDGLPCGPLVVRAPFVSSDAALRICCICLLFTMGKWPAGALFRECFAVIVVAGHCGLLCWDCWRVITEASGPQHHGDAVSETCSNNGSKLCPSQPVAFRFDSLSHDHPFMYLSVHSYTAAAANTNLSQLAPRVVTKCVVTE